MEHAKMIKTAKGLDTFFKVMQKISAIAIAVMLIVMIALTVATLVDPQAVIGKNFDMLDVGELTLRLAPEYVPDNATVLKTAWVMVLFGCLSAAVWVYAFGQLRKLLAPMKDGQPFCEATCTALKRLADCVLALGIIGNVGRIVTVSSTLAIYRLSDVTQGGAITAVSANQELSMDFSFVVTACVIFLLSYIFSYGQALQRESDETL